MTSRIYKTAQGKTVDLGALQLKNEGVRAVGSPVNARGDLIDSHNRPIESRSSQVAKQYKKQITNVSDGAVPTSKRNIKSNVKESLDANTIVEPETENKDNTTGSLGIAGALAKAKSSKQSKTKE